MHTLCSTHTERLREGQPSMYNIDTGLADYDLIAVQLSKQCWEHSTLFEARDLHTL